MKPIFTRDSDKFSGAPQVDVAEYGSKIRITLHSSTMGEETRRCEFSAQETSDLHSALGEWLANRTK